MSRVNIVYNYGDNLYSVYWVAQHGEEIYHGFHFKGKQDFHFSHHKDGKVHLKINGKCLPLGTQVSISEVKDIYNLHNLNAGDEEWAKKYYSPYNNRKLDNIVLVDTRLFSNKLQIQIELYLIKPKSLSLLSGEHFRSANKEDYRLIQIVQDINPRLIVHVRNLKHLKP